MHVCNSGFFFKQAQGLVQGVFAFSQPLSLHQFQVHLSSWAQLAGSTEARTMPLGCFGSDKAALLQPCELLLNSAAEGSE